MRDKNVFGIRRALPRMSWSPRNLYNLYRRSLTELQKETDFTNSGATLFQQRWKAKQLTRAYHGDFINEKIFKRWYLPSTLPDVRPHASLNSPSPSSRKSNSGNGREGDDLGGLLKWSTKDRLAEQERKKREEEEKLALAPVASLMYEEVERRIDVFVFRCCFAHSVYEARRMVIHGNVLLNGKKHTNANTRLAPGDMITVDPKAVSFLKPQQALENTVEMTEGSDARDKSSDQAESNGDSQTPNTSEAPSSGSPVSNANSTLASKTSSEESSTSLTPFNLPPYASPFLFIPPYIEPSFSTCSAVFVRRPTARYQYSEIPSPYDADGELMRLSWEWYNKVRPRMRSKSQRAREPDNRKEVRRIVGVDRGLSRKEIMEKERTGGVVVSSLRAQQAKNSVF